VKQLQCLWLDLGNVLVHFDPKKLWSQVGAVLGISPSEARRRLESQELQWRYEKGLIGTSTFLGQLAGGHQLTRQLESELSKAFCEIFAINAPMVNWVLAMKALGVRLVLVSNTNPLHIEFIQSQFDFLSHFDTLILSHEINFMKPERGFFERAQEKSRSNLEHALYVDDLGPNIAQGKDFGLKTILFREFCPFLAEFLEMHKD
jgi:putative hydrolase of the HAD superfamily